MKKPIILLMIAFILLNVFAGCAGEAMPYYSSDDADLPLKELGEKHDLLIGAALDAKQLDDAEFVEVFIANYNQLTPETSMKLKNIQPNEGVYNFEKCDRIVNFAVENSITVKGHTLVWHLKNPNWLNSKDWTKDELTELMETHISTVMTRYKGKIEMWDVVNEPIKGDTLRETIWYSTIGEEYIAIALKAAHNADPDAKLYINDYNVAEINKKSTALYNLCKELLDSKVPLDGVGFQMHFNAKDSIDFESVYNNIKRFYELGLKISFSEVDVRVPILSGDNHEQKQCEIYTNITALAAYFDCVTCFTTWGMTDKYSWINTKYPLYTNPLLFDRKYKNKPAFYAVQSVLCQDEILLNYSE